jgi:flagellar hook-associated protein 3 FlgL
MMNTQMIRNLSANLNRMDEMQNQLSTGRKINKPSDDPIGLSFALRYRSELSANDQYQANAGSATSWLDFTDSTLSKAGDVFQRVRELAVQGANGTNSMSSMSAIQSEVNQLYSEMVKIGNSDFNGKLVFNGQKTDIPPYTEATAASDIPDSGQIQIEIGAGVRIPVNITGQEVFGDSKDPDNTFKVMQDLITALGKSDFAGVNNVLGRLDSRLDKFLGVRAEIGAKMNRVQLSDDRLKNISANLQSLQTKVEDTDMAETITNLKTAENVYQASLSTGAKIISPSLVDFLH